MDRGLACRDRCEPELRRLLDLRDFSLSQPQQTEAVFKRAGRTSLASGIFYLSLGGAVTIVGTVLDASLTLIALGLLFVGLGGFTLLFGRFKARTDQFRLCPHCGYNLTGNTTGKCSECGKFA